MPHLWSPATPFVLTAILLTSCGSQTVASAQNEANTDTQTPASSTALPACPSTSNAKEIVTYFSGPIAARDVLDDSAFTLAFTNALGEVVDLVEDDAESTPCTGFDELFATLKEWSNVSVKMTESANAPLPTDEELQEIVNLGNEWLEVIERDDLNFSLEPDASSIGN